MIAVHILQWNKSSLTIACLSPLIGVEGFDIRILDNGSQTAEVNKLLDYLDSQEQQIRAKITVYVSNKNLGFSAGHSFLLKQSASALDATIVILNNDVVVKAETIIACSKRLNCDNSLACLVPVELKEHKLVNPVFRYFPYVSCFRRDIVLSSNEKKAKWSYPDGACLIVDSKCIEPADFDIASFCYFEELVLVEKWRSRGKTWQVFHDGFFEHAGGESTVDDNEGKVLRLYNEIWSATWYSKRVFGLMAWPIVLLRNLLRSVVFIYKSRIDDLQILWFTSLDALLNRANRYKVSEFAIVKICRVNHEDTI